MRKRHIVVITLAIVLGLGFAFYPRIANKPLPSAALIAQGQAIFQARCANCHGADLEGQAHWRERRPDGKLPAPPHDAGGHTWNYPDRVLFRTVKEGLSWVAGPNYKSDMPAFAGVLSDQEINAVIAYIKSRWPDELRAHQQAINQLDRQR